MRPNNRPKPNLIYNAHSVVRKSRFGGACGMHRSLRSLDLRSSMTTAATGDYWVLTTLYWQKVLLSSRLQWSSDTTCSYRFMLPAKLSSKPICSWTPTLKFWKNMHFSREYGDTVFENSLVVAREVAEELEMNSDETHFPKTTANCLWSCWRVSQLKSNRKVSHYHLGNRL